MTMMMVTMMTMMMVMMMMLTHPELSTVFNFEPLDGLNEEIRCKAVHVRHDAIARHCHSVDTDDRDWADF